MDPLDRLRLRLVGTGCGACGEPYRTPRIRVLAHREDLAFVLLRCEACGTDALSLVTGFEGGGSAEDAGPIEPLGLVPQGEVTAPDVARLRDAPRIGADDVLDMHAFLAGYRGDAIGLLGGSRPETRQP